MTVTTGDYIRAARKSAGMTQEELASLLGISYTLISQYERGIRKPKREQLQRIADALKVPIDRFLPPLSDRLRELKEDESKFFHRINVFLASPEMNDVKISNMIDVLNGNATSYDNLYNILLDVFAMRIRHNLTITGIKRAAEIAEMIERLEISDDE